MVTDVYKRQKCHQLLSIGFLGLEPRAIGWKVQMNPLSYGDTPSVSWSEKRVQWSIL